MFPGKIHSLRSFRNGIGTVLLLAIGTLRFVYGQEGSEHIPSSEEIETVLEDSVHKVINLGPEINSELGDYRPRVSTDGKTLFLCRKVRNEKVEQEFATEIGKSIETFRQLPESSQQDLFKKAPSRMGYFKFVKFLQKVNNTIKQEDIFVSRLQGERWLSPVSGGEPLSTEDNNEGPESISVDNNLLFIFKNGDIYRTRRYGERWGDLAKVEEPINSSSWDADICFSADGRTLFFASRRAGFTTSLTETEENTDIWVTVKNDSGWSEPVNLGPTINTPMTDRTPFLHADGKTLYFASAGHGGQGGLDLFKTTRQDDSTWTHWSEPVNLTRLNSAANDWDLSMPANSKWLYFTSNRVSGYGLNDIYKYRVAADDTIVGPERSVTLIAGVVKGPGGQPLEADIRWENLDSGELIGMANSNPVTGQFTIALPAGQRYGYYATKDNYWDTSDNIDLTELSDYQEMQLDIVLNPILSVTPPATDVQSSSTAKTAAEDTGPIRLTNIFFAFDSAVLDSTSYSELNRLAEKLLTHSEVNIQIEGHTDSVGTSVYNDSLSQRRADAVRDYLIARGVAPDRLVAVGFGESQPETSNASEEGRARNRRVQFREVGVVAQKG